ncbi:hypothetical protein PAXRUDRAFT_832338 [Paxillus rubicundulus Ve08.2h10]|uniref:BRCT domain-containing protein n=1 Tax=Paxillus rubicundulus Ve08.2h10 TaxID=930991 RepID=A0A0D0CHP4_9AGAM|nr:hypothetical protein PAXRUDRAFT_832338 [Paxillus rubicundulus Ve08.2h10]
MRRRNKSHKVPNVKLRPLQVPTRSGPNAPVLTADASWDHSSDSELAPNASMVDRCPRPFKDVTLCATGIIDKSTLFKMAFELGATSTSDFTDRVTHLIATEHGSAKYMCALERKIPIMNPQWIMDAHAVWLRGDDAHLEEGVSKHRLPIFSGVILSLSGIEDISQRTTINSLLTAQQGVYVKNLERPVKVTHLLCSGDTVTDKMKYAEKFNKRGEANIHLVWEEWFWDCLEFGGRFDERKYQVSRPRPERKSLHERPASSIPVQDCIPGSHSGSAIPVDILKSHPSAPTPKFPIITDLPTDPDEEELATVKKPVPAVTLQLWKSLLRPRGFELEGGKLMRSPSKSQATSSSSPSTPSRLHPRLPVGNRRDNGKGKEKESVISTFRRTNSFAPVPQLEPSLRQRFRRNTFTATLGPEDAEGSGLHDPGHPPGEESAEPGFFTGFTFRLLGEARCPKVRVAIERGGGIVADNEAEQVNFIIVRLISGSKLYRDEPDEYERSKYRTECWLEHSVFNERICQPDENVSFTPFTTSMPIPGAETIHLSLSGLDQSELCWIRRLSRALGVTLAPAFSRRSTHLLCPSGTGAKFDKALEWKIPVVSVTWLEDMARQGTIPAVDGYFVGGSQEGAIFDGDVGHVDAHPQDPNHMDARDKGKGKEKEKGTNQQMANITNSTQPMFAKNPGLLEDTALQDRAQGVLDVPHHDTHYRQEDIELRMEPPQCGGLFGRPSAFLSNNSDPLEGGGSHISPSPPMPPPQSSSPVVEDPPIPLRRVPPFACVSPLRPRPSAIAHKSSRVSIHEVQAQVPSSKSPSPMKLPPSSSIPDVFPDSPLGASSMMRPPDTDAVAKALHESLTSLLGKRQISEEDEEKGTGRRGKRVRPGVRSGVSPFQHFHDQTG